MLSGCILVTGGTGSFGKKFVEYIINHHPEVKRLVVFSRDELKQYEMRERFPHSRFPQLRFFIGDVRDAQRLRRACEGVDVIVHAAALKHVPIAEHNPIECIKTNVLGAENVINAALDMGVKRVVALSTDKAAAPVNLYGATKLCSDKLFIASNNFKGSRDLKFSVVRYGNVFGSRGSVVPFFLEKRKEGVFPVTHPEMTRFSITVEQGIEMVIYAIQQAWGGELFVPKIPSYKVLTLAEAISPAAKIEYVGMRPAEKIHEEMITEMDSFRTFDCGKYYVVIPVVPIWEEKNWMQQFHAQRVPEGFHYSSGQNKDWLSTSALRKLIREQVDPSFELV